MLHLVTEVVASLAGATTDSTPLWEQWAAPEAVERLVQLGGLTLLAWLFATGRIITKSQHESRVADLEKYADAEKAANDANHEREMRRASEHYTELAAEKDRRFEGMKESRDMWKQAAEFQTQRADAATEQLLEVNEVAGLALQAIQGLDKAVASLPSEEEAGVQA